VKLNYNDGRGWLDFGFSCEDHDRMLTSDMTDEEVRRVKVPKVTAIPSGTYQMVWHTRGDGSQAPMLEGVPGFRYILIHVGNDANPDSEGCILIGMDRDEAKGTISKSRVAVSWLYAQLATKGLGEVTVERVQKTTT